MRSPVALDELLGSPTTVDSVLLGRVTGVLLVESEDRAFGLEVTGRSGRWFLPWIAADVGAHGVRAASAIVFGSSEQLDAYARQGARVLRRGTDVHLGHDGRVVRHANGSHVLEAGASDTRAA